jgi:hypothetical protein
MLQSEEVGRCTEHPQQKCGTHSEWSFSLIFLSFLIDHDDPSILLLRQLDLLLIDVY